MTRNPGSTVNTHSRTVIDRDGIERGVDALEVTDAGLYYARPVDFEHFDYQERWILPALGWVVNRFAFRPQSPAACDWYIETELIQVDDAIWRVADGYLDVYVYEGEHYHLEDAGELADGLAAGEIAVADATSALRALDRLCEALRTNDCSGHALLATFAGSLPRSRILHQGNIFTLNVS